jgi:hypothetical protein
MAIRKRPSVTLSSSPTSKTASGFEYGRFRLKVSILAAAERRLAALADLADQLEKWQASGTEKQLSLTVEQIQLVREALRDALLLPQVFEELGDFRDRDYALANLYRENGGDARAVVRAAGWSTGKRRDNYPHDDIVRDYLWLLGRDPCVSPPWLIMMPPRNRDGSLIYPDPPLDPVTALRCVAKSYEFPTPTACRTVLLRIRRERKAAEPSDPRSSFPIPNIASLDRPEPPPKRPTGRSRG